jgi:hypothetical protein
MYSIKKNVSICFIDLSEAYDQVDPKFLLSKLHKYGIRGKSQDWLCKYLINRVHSMSPSVTSNLPDFPSHVMSPQAAVISLPKGQIFIIYSTL